MKKMIHIVLYLCSTFTSRFLKTRSFSINFSFGFLFPIFSFFTISDVQAQLNVFPTNIISTNASAPAYVTLVSGTNWGPTGTNCSAVTTGNINWSSSGKTWTMTATQCGKIVYTIKQGSTARAVTFSNNKNGTTKTTTGTSNSCIQDSVDFAYDGSTGNITISVAGASGGSGEAIVEMIIRAYVTVCNAPSISAHPSASAQNICQNGAASQLSVTATGSGSLTYQWYSNVSNANSGGTLIGGATSNTYTPSTTAGGTALYYYCVVTNDCGGGNTNTAASNVSGLVTVSATSVGGTVNYSGANICISGVPSAALTVSGNTGTTYQWQSSTTDATSGFSDIAGATGATYTPGSIATTTFYRVNVANGTCPAASSVADTIIVTNTTPGITSQPSTAAQTICSGGSLTALSVTATGASLTYQWYSNTSNSNSGGTLISGANSNTYTPSNITAITKYFYCSVASNGGCAIVSNTSGLITVYAASAGGTANYSGANICTSGVPSAAITVSGNTGTTYQWQSSTTDATSGFTDIGGATGASYTPGSIAVTTFYRVNISNGTCPAAASVADTIIVNALPSITAQPSTSAQSIAIGGSLTALSITATGTSLTYQWYKNISNANSGGTLISGATANTYTPSNASSSSYYYYCIVSSGVCTITSNVSGLITVSGTTATDYFRSVASGSWTTAANWQSSSDSVTWFSATAAPTSAAAYVTIQSPNAVTITSSITTGNALIKNGGSVQVNSGGAVSVTAGKLFTIEGTLESTIIGATVFSSTSATMRFAATGIFIQSAPATSSGSMPNPTSQDVQIPYASWTAGALCKITGIIGAADLDYRNLLGVDQTLADVTIDCTNLLGKIVLAYQANDKLVINGTLTVNSLGGNATSNGKMLQITSSSGQRIVTVGNYVQHTGSVYITNQTKTSTGTRSLIVNGSFTVDNAAGTSYFYFGDPQQSGEAITGTLQVVGDFSMASASTAKQQFGAIPSTGTTTAYVIFTGTAAQNAGFGNFLGDINVTVLNSNNVVTLLTNLTVNDTLNLIGKMAINGNTLTIDSVLTGSGSITGSYNSNLTVTNGGSITPSLKFTSGGTADYLKNLTISSSTKASLATSLNITAGATPGSVTLGTNALFTTNDNLVLKSDANGTARISVVPVNGSGVAQATLSGKVTVERFYNAHRSWRLVTAPILSNGAPTINAAWQEGGISITGGTGVNAAPANLNAPYGTHISGPSPGLVSGFDQTPQNNYSILYYTNGVGWTGVPSTFNSLKAYPGYMLFVRGDRSYPITTTTNFTTPVTATLRSKGNIKLGDTLFNVTAGTGFQVIGNPYACTIDFHKATRTGSVSDVFYLWDPNLTGTNAVGAYTSFAWNSATSKYDRNIRSGPSSGATYTGSLDSSIQSGEAFMVTGTGNLTIHESDKLTPTSSSAFRPIGNNQADKIEELRVNLLAKNTDGTISLNDGALCSFSPLFNDLGKTNNAPKLPNISESISMPFNGRSWAIQQRAPVKPSDTIAYVLNKVKLKNYRFEVLAKNMDKPQLSGFLIDNYTHKTTPVDLDGATYYDFTINTDSGSFSSNRFKIVFKKINHDKNIAEDNKDRSIASVQVYPTVFTGNNLMVHLNNMPVGAYQYNLMNADGQIVFTRNSQHSGGDRIERLDLRSIILPKGFYHLEVIDITRRKYYTIRLVK